MPPRPCWRSRTWPTNWISRGSIPGVGGPEAALLLILVVHLIGSVVLIWAIFSGDDEKPDWRGWWRGDDDEPDQPRAPDPRGGLGVPLPDAEQAVARLREPGRLADCYERPARRPAREPERAPVRRP